MKTKEFFSRIDHDRMVAAIAAAEKHTSGQIRVYVSHRNVLDARHAAMQHFLKLGMTRTKERNAVLIFVAPESQRYYLVGDEGIHAKCGDEFWQQVSARMGEHFKKGEFTEGIVHGVEAAGKLLAQHFPPHGPGNHQSPNAVVEG